ncbi:MAG: PepSY-associated TM helix domain-containing protein [Methylomicrobium sp.]
MQRSVWRRVHLYLALSVGLWFVLIGLTGSLSIYREQVDVLLNPSLAVENPPAARLSLDRILASVKAAHPDRHGPWTLEMPETANGMITAWYEKPSETTGEWYAPLMVSINPYNGEVVASRFWGRTLTTWVLDLHTQLLAGADGWRAVGYFGIVFCVSVITGLYLSWPWLRRWPAHCSLRLDQGMTRMAFDLHHWLGFFGALLLPMLILTGIHLSFPDKLEALTGAAGMGHGDNGPPIRSTSVPNNRPVTLEEAVLLARGPFPDAELRRITTPAGANAIYRVDLRQRGEINRKHPLTTVWIDRWSGHIKAARDPYEFTIGQRITTSLWPIHTGEAFGGAGRLVGFVAGGLPLLLYLSGLFVWLRKMGWVEDRPVTFLQCRSIWIRVGERVRTAGEALYRFFERHRPWLETKSVELWRKCIELAGRIAK